MERRHYFGAETRRLKFALKEAKHGKEDSEPTDSDCPRVFTTEARKEWALQSHKEFYLEASKLGLRVLQPYELGETSNDKLYWDSMGIFYFNETQGIAKPNKQEACRPPTPPRVLSQAEEERMAHHRDIALKYRKELHYWIRKPDLELVGSDHLDECSRDPEYWREMAGFHQSEAFKAKTKYQIISSKDLGYILIDTNPETDERYIKEHKMFDTDEAEPQRTHNTDETPKPQKAARSPNITKPGRHRKAKGSKPEASRADSASRGAVSKTSRATPPISSCLRNKRRRLQPAGRPRAAH